MNPTTIEAPPWQQQEFACHRCGHPNRWAWADDGGYCDIDRLRWGAVCPLCQNIVRWDGRTGWAQQPLIPPRASG